MKLSIQITRHIETLDEGNVIFNQVLQHFADDTLIHVNAIADYNFKHPEGPDRNQNSNPHAPKDPA